jgi:hypothetical protein
MANPKGGGSIPHVHHIEATLDETRRRSAGTVPAPVVAPKPAAPSTRERAREATWDRLDHHLEQLQASVVDLRGGIERRSVPRISGAAQVILTRAVQVVRLLGRLDQDMEDDLDLEP